MNKSEKIYQSLNGAQMWVFSNLFGTHNPQEYEKIKFSVARK